jgi:hypothetical protein
MPLVGDFFSKMFRRFPFDDDRGSEFLRSVSGDFGVTPDHIRNDQIHIEELLTLLECHAAWHSGEYGGPRDSTAFPEVMSALAARDTLSYVMSGLLFDAQRSAFEKGAALHRSLVERLEVGDVVISYNYDLIVEYALTALGRFSPTDYHVPFFGEIDGTDIGHSDIDPFGEGAASGISLLKLHGSLNWLHRKHEYLGGGRTKTELPLGQSLFLRDAFQVFVPPGSSGKVFSVLDMPASDDDEEDSYELEFINLVPIIVAPTFDKSVVWGGFGGVLRNLWDRAHSALAQSNHLVIVGYSLRDADFQSIWLFRTALAKRSNTREIWIVNPCQDDCDRLTHFFSDYGRVKTAKSLDEYLSNSAA